MSNAAQKTAQDLNRLMHSVKAVIEANPDMAAFTYAKAAERVRSMVLKPENKGLGLQIQAIAQKLDELAIQSTVPQVDMIDGEAEIPYMDDPAGEVRTEFDGVVEDHTNAQYHEDGSPASELAAAAAFSQFQKDRAREISLPVQITPESSADGGNKLSDTVLVRRGGSSGSGSYTQSGGNAGPVVAEQETSVIRWDGKEGIESVPCVISLSRLVGGSGATYPLAADGTNTYSYRPFARILWGSGSRGQANEALVDICNGTQLVISANHVYVNVGMEAFSATVTLDSPKNYIAGSMYLSGHMGFFKGGSVAPVTKTEYIDQLAEAATDYITIPQFAKTLLPPQCTRLGSSGAETRLDFQDINGNTIYSLRFVNGTIVSPIPISNDAYRIAVTNVLGSNGTAAYRFVFQLAL